jgi:capsular exopolysaccharide synthesis family protein
VSHLVLKSKKKTTVLQQRRKLVTSYDPKSPISEQYRTIRTNIEFSSIDEEIKSLMVTSSGPGEGKSTTTANLAIVFAEQGKRVLLVDGDLRKPTVHYTFNLTNTSGFTSVLTKQLSLEKAVKDTDIKNLYILTCGPIPPNPSELLGSKSMELFFEAAYEEFDMIIFDTPPVLAVTDAQILANKCDGTLLVVNSGKTETEQVVKVKDLLSHAKSKLLGVVLNNQKLQDSNFYYYYGTN